MVRDRQVGKFKILLKKNSGNINSNNINNQVQCDLVSNSNSNNYYNLVQGSNISNASFQMVG